VICAYPISPQTHIVEALGEMVKAGRLTPCEFINVESEFAAMSVAIGASAAGARAYTATASQGLLFMVEAVYNASGLGLPIVMTVANRAIGAPINIWNDHSDSLSQRDSGWMQLFAETNQEAVDLHIQAFRLAEELSMPIMVCMDGFILTHAFERVDIPSQEQVDTYLPPFEPRQVLDPAEPVSIGAMVGPEAFMEVKYLAHAKQMQAIERIPQLAAEFSQVFGRDSGGLVRTYRSDDAETIIIAMGSVLGTIKDTVDEMRCEGHKIGVLGIISYRPFPLEQVALRTDSLQTLPGAGKKPRGRHGRDCRHRRAHGCDRNGTQRLHRDCRPGWPSHPEVLAAQAVPSCGKGRPAARHLPRFGLGGGQQTTGTRKNKPADPAPSPRTCCTTRASCRRSSAKEPSWDFNQ